MTVKELIEELQKCRQDLEVDTFHVGTGDIYRVASVDGIGYMRTAYLNLENV